MRRLTLRPAPLLLLFCLVLICLATVLPSLADDPILGGDEGWIMSASAKLADEGVFGSDLFAGFYGADEHYLFNLPLHHLLLAAVFEVAGSSIETARLVSVLFGLLLLLLTYALGRRLGGEAVGLGAASLVVLLRLNLAPFSGLTLTDLGATVRYDLIAVPYGLAAVLVVLRKPAAPGALSMAAAGLLVGLAALTQFIGAFFLLPVALYVLLLGAPAPARRVMLVAVLFVVAALTVLPYGLYTAAHWQDFQAQARAGDTEIEGGRASFLSPSFYWRQVKGEPDRYAAAIGLEETPDSWRDILTRPSAKLALIVVGPVALAWALWRARGRSLPHRMLALLLVSLILQLALLDATKRFVYWVVVVPFLCVAVADLAAAVWRWRPTVSLAALAGRCAVLAVAAVFAVEGLAVAAQDVRDAGDAPDYDVLASRLRAAIPANAVAMGDNRLWPALRDRPYRSLFLLFYETNPEVSRERTTDIAGVMQRHDIEYLLLSPLSHEMLLNLTPRDSAALDMLLTQEAELTETLDFPAYGPIEVYRLRR